MVQASWIWTLNDLVNMDRRTEICRAMYVIRWMPFSISVTKGPVVLLVNFSITSGVKYGQQRSKVLDDGKNAPPKSRRGQALYPKKGRWTGPCTIRDYKKSAIGLDT